MSAMKASKIAAARDVGRRVAASSQTKAKASLDKKPIADIWRDYQRTKSNLRAGPKAGEVLRNFLMEKYLHLVRYNAERIYSRLPDEVDIEDLMSAGLFGLMDAIDAFDLDRKVKFETYCAPRIRGAILDELRAMDWVPRLVRHRTAKVETARQHIEMELGRPASDDEVAERLGVDAEEFDKIKRDSSAVSTHSITRNFTSNDGGRELREIDVVRDESESNPTHELQRRDLKELITRGLTRAERLIVILYYYEGMTMKEIGATLDLSESRVSQMHSSILQRLKAHMQTRAIELEPLEASFLT